MQVYPQVSNWDMKWYQSLSIKYKIVLFSVASSIVIVNILNGIFYQLSSANLHESAKKELESTYHNFLNMISTQSAMAEALSAQLANMDSVAEAFASGDRNRVIRRCRNPMVPLKTVTIFTSFIFIPHRPFPLSASTRWENTETISLPSVPPLWT